MELASNAFRILEYLASHTADKSEALPAVVRVRLGLAQHEYLEAFGQLEETRLARDCGDWLELTAAGWEIAQRLFVVQRDAETREVIEDLRALYEIDKPIGELAAYILKRIDEVRLELLGQIVQVQAEVHAALGNGRPGLKRMAEVNRRVILALAALLVPALLLLAYTVSRLPGG
jgi:hypothetical protein